MSKNEQRQATRDYVHTVHSEYPITLPRNSRTHLQQATSVHGSIGSSRR